MTRGFRLNLILVLFALGTTLAAVAGWRFARASAPVSGPIVLVTIDALRADRMPVYGYRGVKTPAFEALAADGVVFERALSHAPLTLPAHTSLLSGQLPPTTGVRDNVGTVVPPSVRFISSLLADRGYNTGGVVSSYMLRRETGMDQGFAFFEDELRPASESSDDP
ncbi:MAG: sulfatase-like hydrolase/transferase, partial [Vicinamibacterales bacterium]